MTELLSSFSILLFPHAVWMGHFVKQTVGELSSSSCTVYLSPDIFSNAVMHLVTVVLMPTVVHVLVVCEVRLRKENRLRGLDEVGVR